MEYSEISRAGFSVSRLTLGTVEFGLGYGIGKPGSSSRPSAQEAEDIVRSAVEHGINLFDTAPAYGESEVLLGKILAGIACDNLYVATKVGPFADVTISSSEVRLSLERSLTNLQREKLDLVQIHNATYEQLYRSPLMNILAEARQCGQVGAIGASVYGVDAALAAIDHPDIATIQVAYNLLDQRMADTVLPLAKKRGIAVLARSVFLKGVLTSRRYHLPERLSGLKDLADKAESWTQTYGLDLPEAALRFCLSNKAVGSVLVGVSSTKELLSALIAMGRGALPTEMCATAENLAGNNDLLIDPRFWGID